MFDVNKKCQMVGDKSRVEFTASSLTTLQWNNLKGYSFYTDVNGGIGGTQVVENVPVERYYVWFDRDTGLFIGASNRPDLLSESHCRREEVEYDPADYRS